MLLADIVLNKWGSRLLIIACHHFFVGNVLPGLYSLARPHAWSKKKTGSVPRFFFLLGAIFANNTTFLQTKKRDLPKSEYEALKQYKIMSKDTTCQTHQSRSTSVSVACVGGKCSCTTRPRSTSLHFTALLHCTSLHLTASRSRGTHSHATHDGFHR